MKIVQKRWLTGKRNVTKMSINFFSYDIMRMLQLGNHTDRGILIMSRGTNQKFKLYHLKNIMINKTDDTHSLTMTQILDELEKCEVTAERKSIYTYLQDLEKLGIEISSEQVGKYTYNIRCQ